ncbi:hypothetical protein PoB_006618300 [Plakobranchus ocellatus]|uniref:Uncharacterized protein n=1 Tax=Plakobranchus ocellatus TaxID=259542 RepID=A0AAV4D6A1_9GAST|nr:hypothetical protein PoB_006618300 [Plakobranchus ocellatus]
MSILIDPFKGNLFGRSLVIFGIMLKIRACFVLSKTYRDTWGSLRKKRESDQQVENATLRRSANWLVRRTGRHYPKSQLIRRGRPVDKPNTELCRGSRGPPIEWRPIGRVAGLQSFLSSKLLKDSNTTGVRRSKTQIACIS